MMRVSAGVGTCSHPLRTLNASSQTIVWEPAPSDEALVPVVPIAPVVAPVMTEALGSAGFSLAGVTDVTVGNTDAFVASSMRCCAEVAFADWPTQYRRNSRLTDG